MNARRPDEQDPEIIRLDLGIEDITLGHLIEAQERFLSLIREVAGAGSSATRRMFAGSSRRLKRTVSTWR